MPRMANWLVDYPFAHRLYPFALDFVNAVRAYGTSLLGVIEKSDGAALSVLQQTVALDIQHDMDQIFQWQIDKAQHDIEAANHALELLQSIFRPVELVPEYLLYFTDDRCGYGDFQLPGAIWFRRT